MTRRTRRLIFYSLILIFIFVTPATILYATGFNFDWQQKQFFRTGAFYFKSLPGGAQIFINGKLKNTTPASIKRLIPKSYSVTISKDGFFSWQKNLEIKSQIVTEARNIFLAPKNPAINLTAQNVTSTKEYFLTDEQIAINQQASTTINSVLKDVTSFVIFENDIYYLQAPNLILYQTDLAGLSRQQISFESLPPPKASYKIEVSPEQIAVFESGGKLYLLNQETKIFKSLADEVKGVEFSPDNKKLLWWDDHEIWVLWLKEVLIQPYRQPGDKELITRFANKITQAIWFTQTNEHIIFVVQEDDGSDKIKITELDGRDLRNTYDIATFKDPEVYYNERDDLFYVLTDHKLHSLDLLP